MRKGIYQDKNGKWFIDTKIKINDKYHHCTIRGFNSKKEADLNYEYEIDKWKRQHHFYENSELFEEIANDYFEYAQISKSSKSVDAERTQFKLFWFKVFPNETLSNALDIKTLRTIYKDICNNNDFNARKKHDLIFAFRNFANYCYLHKLISHELYQDIDIIMQPIKYSKTVENEKRVISDNEIKAILGAINKNHRDLPMFTLFVELGARISEFLGILVSCYDREKRIIEIKRQLLTDGTMTNKLKTTNSYRKILISKSTADLLNEYLDNNSLKPNDRLFNISHTEFRRRLNHYEDLAKTPRYATHEFRHTRATKLANACVSYSDVVVAARLLGHSVSMFSDRYCNHLKEKDMESLLERL